MANGKKSAADSSARGKLLSENSGSRADFSAGRGRTDYRLSIGVKSRSVGPV